MGWGAKMAVALMAVLGAGPATALATGPAYDPQPPGATASNRFEAISPAAGSAPDTAIERSVLRAASRSAGFWFSASEAVQGFRCQLDKGDYKPCGPPRAYKHLKPGWHAFRVFAIDLAGNGDASPAVVHFRVPKPYRGRR
ncbi:MAG TPA: hypothetical protein VFK14_09690 [Solirubrobacterales bacterium]|nr:hypothetical protein [Solirubrobacterales bacterium]